MSVKSPLTEYSSHSAAPKLPWKKRLIWATGTVLVALVSLAPVIAERYNVAATEPHLPLLERMLRSGMERSIAYHSRSVELPTHVNLLDPQLAARAISHYDAACVGCHSAPGKPRDPWMVLYPPPADLTDHRVVDRLSDRELYWIIKHGVKDTGMIALGPTHQESDLWAVSAFVRQLPGLSSEQYAALIQGSRGAMSKKPAVPDSAEKSEHASHQHKHHEHSETPRSAPGDASQR